MKKIGLIGGMSWESTADYYRILNNLVKENLGGLHSAECVIDSLDFAVIEALQRGNEWNEMARILAGAGRNLEHAGAQCAIICTNTMHKVAPQVESSLNIPLIDMIRVTAKTAADKGFHKVGLLGTRFTMEDGFYQKGLADFGIDCVTPEKEDRIAVHDIIYKELCIGKYENESRKRITEIIEEIAERGAEAVILGCTEIPLLVRPTDSPIPTLNTTRIHAQAALDYALA